MEIDLSEDGYNSVQTFKEFQVCLVKIPTDWTLSQPLKNEVNIHSFL